MSQRADWAAGGIEQDVTELSDDRLTLHAAPPGVDHASRFEIPVVR